MKRFKVFHRLWVLLILLSCNPPGPLLVGYQHPSVIYSGRIDSLHGPSANLYWPATSVTLNFEGEALSATLQDSRGENYYNVMVDDDSLYILRPDTVKKTYTLAQHLGSGPHRVTLFKRTEWDRGPTAFFGFQIDGHGKVLPPPVASRKRIEFFGNSITSGYAVEDLSGEDSPDSTYTNAYLSYASLLARHYDADYHCTCKGGIGITVSWFPLIMPEIYNRIVPTDSLSRWDFSAFVPDLVIVNLFQNDSWLVNLPDHEEFKHRFGSAPPTDEDLITSYQHFIMKIREAYPQAKIICTLGNMDATKEGSKWPGLVTTAVNRLGDAGIFAHIMPYKGAPGHPSVPEQKVMADDLIQFIDQNIKW